MDKCQEWIFRNQKKLSYFLLLGAVIGGVNCLSRPDYNLIIYLYLYFIWEISSDTKEMQNIEKLNSWFFLAFSILIDIFWTIFWSGKWSHIKDLERFIHIFVIILSWVGIGLKGFIIFAIGLIEWSSIKSSLPKTVQEKLTGQNYKEQQDDPQSSI
jgi:uncharacterized membrane protein